MTDTKERIITQALIYFSENDYDRASLNSIAGALNITKGAIYHYFGSKDELFKESVIYFMKKLFNSYSDMFGLTDSMSTEEVIEMWFRLERISREAEEQIGINMSNYTTLIYLMFSAIKKFPEVGELIGRMYNNSIVALSRFLKSAQSRGEINKDLDVEALAFEMAAFTEGAMLMSSVEGSINLVEMGQRTFKNFWNRIKPV